MMPAAMIVATALPARSTSSKAASRPGARGPGQQPHRDLDNDPEHSLGAGQQRQQVVAGASRLAPPMARQLAIHGDDLEREDVVHRETVLQAMHATGILGDVAADGAGDLRRGIRRVVEPEVLPLPARSRGCARRAARARCARAGSICRMQLNFARLSSTPSASGSAPPESPVPAPRATTGTPRALHVRSTACTCPIVSGNTTTSGRLPISRQAVALVGRQLLVTRQHRGLREQRPERAQQGVATHACLLAGLGNSLHRSSIRPILRHASKCRRARVARNSPHRRGFTGCRDSSKQGMRLPPNGA